jgi:hypothetical protein
MFWGFVFQVYPFRSLDISWHQLFWIMLSLIFILMENVFLRQGLLI